MTEKKIKDMILKDIIRTKGNPTIHNLKLHISNGNSEKDTKNYLHSTLKVFGSLNEVSVSKELSDQVYDYLKENKYLNDIDFYSLTPGDKLLLRSHEIVEFIEMKRTNFIGRMNGKNYRIPIMSAIEVVEKAKPKEKFDVTKLKANQYFYINHKGIAELFIFKEIKNNKVVGINPTNQGLYNIAIDDFNFNPLDICYNL
ncbi:hypothetical protein KHQ81_15880 (plasmid) [Mycoplasmatota bacterium]|nr:hypothetical protein KHQ81_15880 [Mycoplasmatota bacterium]